jgi:signal transduction histidine kinase
MWSNIKQFLTPPVFEDEDKTRIANLLSVTILTLLLIAILRTALAVWSTQQYLTVVLRANGVLYIVSAGVFVLMRTGRVRLACVAFTLYQWVAIAWLTYRYGGVNLSLYSFFIFVILAAGLLLGGRWAIGYAVASVMYGALLFYLESDGVIRTAAESSIAAFSTVTPSFITTAVLVYLYHRDITRALARLRRNSAEVAKTNEQLTHEIVERERIEEELSQARKMEAMGQFASIIAHDFSNLLTTIMGYGELLRAEIDEDSPARGHVEMILTVGAKSANLIHQILAFSRKQTISLRQTDLNELIKQTGELLRKIVGESVEISMTLNDMDLMVRVDPEQFEQVLMNMCTNARDAMPDGGTIFISTGKSFMAGDYVKAYDIDSERMYALISVRDTGSGMDRETRKRIFEPFFTTKEVGKGTGLGLASAYGIIKQHNGHIDVFSEPGKGTTFKIYLPLIATPVNVN